MPPIAGPIIAGIAAELLKKFATKLGAEKPEQASVEKLLARLVLEEFVDFGGNDADHGVAQAEKVISKLKKLILGELTPDGSPTNILIQKVLDACLGNSLNRHSISPSESRVNRSVQRGELVDFMYWVDPNALPSIDGDSTIALKLLQKAFNAWQKVAFIRVQMVDAEKDADVLIVKKQIDGNAGKLAVATVGDGPGDHRIKDFTFDAGEDWTKEKFFTTVIHEIGHLIGLDHSTSSSDIMFDTLTSFAEPQPNDVRRAVAIWGAPPTRPTAEALIDLSNL